MGTVTIGRSSGAFWPSHAEQIMNAVRAIQAEWYDRGKRGASPEAARRAGGRWEVRTVEIVVLTALLIPGALLLVLLAITLFREWFSAGRHGHVPPPAAAPPLWQQSRRLRGKSESDQVK
jgi:hypothetical protein